MSGYLCHNLAQVLNVILNRYSIFNVSCCKAYIVYSVSVIRNLVQDCIISDNKSFNLENINILFNTKWQINERSTQGNVSLWLNLWILCIKVQQSFFITSSKVVHNSLMYSRKFDDSTFFHYDYRTGNIITGDLYYFSGHYENLL